VQRRPLASLCAVLFITFLDNTVISVALANVQSTLHPGIQDLQWIVDGYMLAFAALMLTGGTLGDLLGRRKVMLSGMAVFCAGSVVCALAPNSGVLIAGRVVMGVGAAASEPGTLSVLRHIFPDPAERARALGAWTAVSGAALALGPIAGGLIVAVSDWRGVFWFNVAFGALAFMAAALTVPETSDPEGRRLDLRGLVLGAGTVLAATFAIIEGESVGYGTWWVLLLFAVAVLCGVVFVVAERHAPDPVLRLSLFSKSLFVDGNVVAFVANWGVFAVFFFVSFYLQLIANLSPGKIALQFVALAVAMWAAAAVGSWWTARSGPRGPMVVGCALAGIGLFIVNGYLDPNVGIGSLAWSLAIVGFGLGMAFVAMTAAVLSTVPAARSGMAASTVNTSRELGGVFGVAILGAILNGQITGSLAERLRALGIPANFRELVINAVTHGGVPKSAGAVSPSTAGGAAQGQAKLVNDVIHAAENAFVGGLHLSLVLAGSMLLAAAALVLVTMRLSQRGPGRRGVWRRRRASAPHSLPSGSPV
jgi:EmrB/QacA subfamily drug resistance transporter